MIVVESDYEVFAATRALLGHKAATAARLH